MSVTKQDRVDGCRRRLYRFRIVEDHELDEVHTAPARSMAQHGHNSPVVILREHNRVVSLAPDMKPVPT